MTGIEGDEVLEDFEQPVPTISADADVPAGKACVRVLPRGHGRIATGHYDRTTNAFTYHSKGDHLIVDAVVAKSQEDNGLVETVNGG